MVTDGDGNMRYTAGAVPRVDAFLAAIDAVCRAHSTEIGHEDGHGCFIVRPYAGGGLIGVYVDIPEGHAALKEHVPDVTSKHREHWGRDEVVDGAGRTLDEHHKPLVARFDPAAAAALTAELGNTLVPLRAAIEPYVGFLEKNLAMKILERLEALQAACRARARMQVALDVPRAETGATLQFTARSWDTAGGRLVLEAKTKVAEAFELEVRAAGVDREVVLQPLDTASGVS